MFSICTTTAALYVAGCIHTLTYSDCSLATGHWHIYCLVVYHGYARIMNDIAELFSGGVDLELFCNIGKMENDYGYREVKEDS